MAKKTIEDVLQQYAQTAEGAEHLKENGIEINTEQTVEEQEYSVETEEKPRAITAQESFAQHVQESLGRPTMQEAHDIRLQEIKSDLASSGLGFIEIPIDSLPTQGLFYPEGTRIFVRAAQGAELRHWSMTNEQELSEIDDALNYIFQRCVKISFPDGKSTWEDTKDIDRLYLILAVRDFTFEEGQNELKINVSEKETIVVHKENISFIELGEKIMKYYNSTEKCFTFPTKNKLFPTLNFYLPSLGVTRWLKGYIQKKSQSNVGFDKEFVTVAPMLIKDHRKLNEKTYTDLINQSMSFTNYEWSLISKVKSAIENSVTPKLKYVDAGGAEQETPLNFQGGIKAIFNLNLDDEIDL